MSQYASQLTQDDVEMTTDSQSSWKSWSDLNKDQAQDVNELFAKLEPVQEEKVEDLFNNIAVAVDEGPSELDTDTVSTMTVGTMVIPKNSPVFNLINNISAKLLNFLPTTSITQAQYSLAIDDIKDNMKTEFKRYIEKIPTIQENTQNLWNKINVVIDTISPKPGLNVDELKSNLEDVLRTRMEELHEKFVNVKANVETHLQNTAKKAISEEAIEKSTELLASLETYKKAMDSVIDILLDKELSTDQQKQILSLWNNLLSLDGLIQQYNDSKKVFNTEEFDIIIDYLKDLTVQLQDLKDRFEGAPSKKAKIEEPPVAPAKSAFSLEGLTGMFSMGKKGGSKRKTKKAHRFSKKPKKTSGNKNKSKKNRKTKRSKK
jgi:hypothetical protein